jgi:CHAD domain-containing protein
MASSYLPSAAHIAGLLYTMKEGASWDDAPDQERDYWMRVAKAVIAEIESWQARNKTTNSPRYSFETAKDDDGNLAGFAIFDRIKGLNEELGVIQDPMLAQQIVDDLNKREAGK